jgi:hypothetical protein
LSITHLLKRLKDRLEFFLLDANARIAHFKANFALSCKAGVKVTLPASVNLMALLNRLINTCRSVFHQHGYRSAVLLPLDTGIESP